jgi:5-methyltetrahydropteroyltriglutamate--homocysteine methyltransferase
MDCRIKSGNDDVKIRPRAARFLSSPHRGEVTTFSVAVTCCPMLLPTSLVGSYPQPDWLVDRERLSKDVPRIRAEKLWRVAPDKLEAAQDDATILAIRDQERAGLSIITDGEQRRESYSNRFATALAGIDADHPGTTLSRIGKPIPVPRIVGPIRRTRPVLLRDLKVLRANTERPIKMTLPGPFTMSKQAQDDFYKEPEAVAFAFAAAVNAEIRDLFAAGADIVQLDEPWMQQHPDDARRYGLSALNRALDGVTGTVAVHLCFGYAALVHQKPAGYSFLPELENCKAQQISIEAAQPRLDLNILKNLPTKTIVLGVNDLADENAETSELVAERIRAALAVVPAERLAVAPDCGMKYLPRPVAFAKMKALADGAAIVRREIEGG